MGKDDEDDDWDTEDDDVKPPVVSNFSFGAGVHHWDKEEEKKEEEQPIKLEVQKIDEKEVYNPRKEMVTPTHSDLSKDQQVAAGYATHLGRRNIFTVLAAPLARMMIDNNSLSGYQAGVSGFSIDKFYKLRSKIDKIIESPTDKAMLKAMHMRLSFELIRAYLLNENLQTQTSFMQDTQTADKVRTELLKCQDFMLDEGEPFKKFSHEKAQNMIALLSQTEIAALDCPPDGIIQEVKNSQFSQDIIQIVQRYGGNDLKDALTQILKEHLSRIPKEQYTENDERIERDIRTLLDVEADVDIGIKYEPHKGARVQFNDKVSERSFFNNSAIEEHKTLDLTKKPQFGSALPEFIPHSRNVVVMDPDALDDANKHDPLDNAIQKGITKEEAEELLNGVLTKEMQQYVIDAVKDIALESKELNSIDESVIKERLDACVENLIPVLEKNLDKFDDSLQQSLQDVCNATKSQQKALNNTIRDITKMVLNEHLQGIIHNREVEERKEARVENIAPNNAVVAGPSSQVLSDKLKEGTVRSMVSKIEEKLQQQSSQDEAKKTIRNNVKKSPKPQQSVTKI